MTVYFTTNFFVPRRLVIDPDLYLVVAQRQPAGLLT